MHAAAAVSEAKKVELDATVLVSEARGAAEAAKAPEAARAAQAAETEAARTPPVVAQVLEEAHRAAEAQPAVPVVLVRLEAESLAAEQVRQLALEKIERLTTEAASAE